MKKRLILFFSFMLVLSNICFAMPRAESVSGDASNSANVTSGDGAGDNTEDDRVSNSIKIKFVDEGVDLKVITIPKGGSVQVWTPEKRDYKFLYWKYRDENGYGAIVTEETKFYENTILRAFWEYAPEGAHPTNGLPMEYEYQTPQNIYTSIKKVKVRNNQVIVTVKKDKRAMSYTVKYSTSKKFSPKKTKEMRYKKNKITLKGLKKGKTYYIQAVIKPRDATKYRAYASKIKKVKMK